MTMCASKGVQRRASSVVLDIRSPLVVKMAANSGAEWLDLVEASVGEAVSSEAASSCFALAGGRSESAAAEAQLGAHCIVDGSQTQAKATRTAHRWAETTASPGQRGIAPPMQRKTRSRQQLLHRPRTLQS